MKNSNYYNEKFYCTQKEKSLVSAKEVVPLVMKMCTPKTVVDVGCGVGTWSSIFRENGCKVLGIDGDYVDRNSLYIPKDEFMAFDLSKKFTMDKKFDLAISLEVAEHIAKEKARVFVSNLINLSDVILFSAAIPKQGGVNHINEQYPSYWIKLFKKNGFVAFDVLRGMIWDNDKIELWYRENIMIFVSERALQNYPGITNCQAINPVDIVHPEMFKRYSGLYEERGFRKLGLKTLLLMQMRIIKFAPEILFRWVKKRL